MKIVTLILTFILAQNCATQEIDSFSYKASSRGYYKEIIVTPEKVVVMNTPDRVIATTTTLSKQSWDKLLKASKKVNVKDLSSIEAPSHASHYDGAAGAVFTVVAEGASYSTTDFDEGNPPSEIKELVTLMLELAKE